MKYWIFGMTRRLVFDALGIILSLGIIMAAIEAYVRVIADDGMQYDLEMLKYARDVKRISPNPLIGHEHAGHRQRVLMGVDFRTNAKGLRDREFSYDRQPGKLRILMLGDSLTVGWGVPVERTFSKRIEELFAADGVDAEVINMGVGNYNTIQEAEYFLAEGFKYQPDIVVLNFFVNDAEPIPKHDPPSILARLCYACIFISGRLDTLGRKFLNKKDWEEYYLSLFDGGDARGWLNAKESIGKLAAYCRSHRIALVIANLPELHDVRHYPFEQISNLVQDAANQYSANYVDILPYLQKEESAALWVTPADPHPNARANDLIAQGIYRSLKPIAANIRVAP
jgi:lysophospholipase L1-like esterase